MGVSIEGFDIGEIESKLCQIRDVRAARIIKGKSNFIEEIHVIAAPDRGPKQLVRDIESILMAQYGLNINHKKVSIAQINDSELPLRTTKNLTRPRIRSINADVTGLNARVQVALELNGEEFTGVSEGLASQTGQIRLVANAALNAVEKFVQGPYGFALEDVAILSLGRERVAVACVAVVSSLGEQIFAGSAVVRQSEKDSVVRATLDAINRRFGFLTTA
jgi:hypothetical protein